MNKQVIEQPQSLALKGKNSISGKTVYPILVAISISHLLNDALQSIIPAIYPVVKESFSLSFAQVGLITLTFQLSASLLQPFVGLYIRDNCFLSSKKGSCKCLLQNLVSV